MRFAWSWPGIDVTGLDPTMVTVSRDPDGRWFATFACDVAVPAGPAPTGQNVGVDLGPAVFAALSTGEKIDHPRHMERRERRLKRRTIAVIDRWYPSSKTCSACGHLLGTLSLGTRHWRCPTCGTRHDRDVNAAKNILVAAGLAETQNACGADVRHEGQPSVQPAMNQENPRVTTGIPVP